jgi:hypothetical protein
MGSSLSPAMSTLSPFPNFSSTNSLRISQKTTLRAATTTLFESKIAAAATATATGYGCGCGCGPSRILQIYLSSLQFRVCTCIKASGLSPSLAHKQFSLHSRFHPQRTGASQSHLAIFFPDHLARRAGPRRSDLQTTPSHCCSHCSSLVPPVLREGLC